LLLAYADDATVRRVSQQLPVHRNRTLPTRDDLATIRAGGWSVSVDEMEDGLTSLAAPISTPGGGVPAALAIAGATTRIAPDRYDEVRGLLSDACREIASRSS